jgi:hypothetical protein
MEKKKKMENLSNVKGQVVKLLFATKVTLEDTS